MKHLALFIALLLAMLAPTASFARSGGHAHSGYGRYHVYSSRSYSGSHGRIRRSRAARAEFEREHPCPTTGRTSGACPGYVVDHVKPLACGGADAPSNMQWQTVAEGKAKDKWERVGCK
jgi:hypothetical protein